MTVAALGPLGADGPRGRTGPGRRLLPTVACVAMCLAFGSCGSGADISQASHVDDLPRLEYVEEVRIGDRDDPDAGFSRIGDIEVDADGTLYVVETQAREVRVFDPDGRRLRTVGGPGEGPGEFSRPISIGLLGDTLWVRDAGRRRISWFRSDGTLVHETPGVILPVGTDVPGMTLQVTLGDPREDGLIGTDYNRIMGGGAADRPFWYPVVRFDREGGVVDTIRWDTVSLGPTVRVGGRALHPPALRPTQPVVETLDGERFELRWEVSESFPEGTLELLRLSASGDTLFRQRLRYNAMALPESVRDSLLDVPEGMGRLYDVSDEALVAAMASGLDLPDYRPPLRSSEVGVRGNLWIELSGESTDSTSWALFHADLSPWGYLVLPSTVEPRYIEDSTVWAVDVDELDVPWLVRLEIRQTGSEESP